jgi:hypothetical protein
MPGFSIKGNNSGVIDNASDLTTAQVKSMLAIASADIIGTLDAAQLPAITGDVTSGSGTLVTTIEANVVGNTKLAQMPTMTIKSNPTGVTANPGDYSLSAIMDSINNTQGALFTRTAIGWVGLVPGIAGQALTSGGPGTNAYWSTMGNSTPSLSSLSAATAANTINSAAFPQTWNWVSATTQNPMTMTATALTTGSLLTLMPGTNAISINSSGRLLTTVGDTTNTTPVLTTGSISDFMETKTKNTSGGILAQSGFTAENDTGSATSGFAWMGINGSNFANPQTYNAGVAGDVTYVGSGQDMIIANASQTKAIKFQTGKATTPFFDNRMTILNSGLVGINTITPLSHLDINGSIGYGTVSTTNASYTVTTTDVVVFLTSSTAQTITLPNPSSFARRVLTIINTGTANKTTSIGYTSLLGMLITFIPVASFVTIQSDGTTWKTIASNYTPRVQFKVTHTGGTGIVVPSGVNTVIPYNTENYDVFGNINAGVFVAPAGGVYVFSAGVSLGATSIIGDAYIELYNQTTTDSMRANLCVSGGTSGFYAATISGDMSVLTGDAIVVRIRHNSNLLQVTGSTSNLMWFSGRGSL